MPLHAFKITCLTNLHNGSGDESFGVIDNLVQRDAADGLPVIHGPSLKGSLREFFEFYKGKKSALVRHVFGAEPGENVSEANGNYVFHAANLLALPVRTNATPYSLATAKHAAAQFKRMSQNAATAAQQNPAWLTEIEAGNPAKGSPIVYGVAASGDLYLDDFQLKGTVQAGGSLPNLTAFLDNETRLALLHDDDFHLLCDDLHLPVRARNQLEKGESKNLWYEQFVPRMSWFYTFVTVPERDTHWTDFQTEITTRPVQIGGNKSVGDGQCLFSLIF